MTQKFVVTLQRQNISGCSSARLEYASGGRVVGRSNRLTPTAEKQGLTKKCKSFSIVWFAESLPQCSNLITF